MDNSLSSKSKPKSTAPSLGYLAGPLRSPQRTPAINPPLPAPNVASLVTQLDSSENSTYRRFATSSHYRNLSRSLLTWFESLNVPRCEFLPTWMPQNGLNVVDRFGRVDLLKVYTAKKPWTATSFWKFSTNRCDLESHDFTFK